jgi:hypothetical protein
MNVMQARAAAQDADEKLDLPQWLYPLLVTFGDINDPKSVQRVDPANLAASFGPGIRLKRITVEVTDDDVTSGIEKRLRWFGGYKDRQLDGHRYNDSITLANSLNRLAFSQGLQK